MKKPNKKTAIFFFILQILLIVTISSFVVTSALRYLSLGQQACLTQEQINADSRCLYILNGKVYEKGTRSNPHRGHACGTDVSGAIGSVPSHLANVAFYLDPALKGIVCQVQPTPTATQIPTQTPTQNPTSTPTSVPPTQTANLPTPTPTSISPTQTVNFPTSTPTSNIPSQTSPPNQPTKISSQTPTLTMAPIATPTILVMFGRRLANQEELSVNQIPVNNDEESFLSEKNISMGSIMLTIISGITLLISIVLMIVKPKKH